MTNTTTPGETRTSPPHPTDLEPLATWLASAHPSPSTAHVEWSSAARLAMLPLGRRFDAVRLPENVVHVVAGSEHLDSVGDRLAQYLNGGPVIHETGFRRYYALVPPGTSGTWTARAAECLGEGTYLGVPRVDRTELDEHAGGSYWVVPMTRPGALCTVANVLQLAIWGGCLTDDEGES